jgi:GntR family transcriptional regulator
MPDAEGARVSAVDEAYRDLSELIRRRVLPAGGRLPGERQLAARLGVSRSTLRLALGRLAEEGRLTRSAQRGWFVPREVVGEPPSTLQSFSEMAAARGLRAGAQVLSRRVRTADFEEARRLAVAPATRVLELRRLRTMDAVPVCVDVSVVILSRVPALAETDLADRSLYATIEQLSDVRIARSAYTVRAEACDAENAELLQLSPGAPVLVGDELTYDTDGGPILLGQSTYRGDAYRFQADLFRRL